MRREWAAMMTAGALLIGAACSGGDNNGDGAHGGSRKLFQPAGVVGPDSFAPTFELTQYDVEPTTSSGNVKGSAPGLYAGRTYGGSGTNICDVEAMIRFLTYYEDRGRAWASIQGISFEELPAYLRSLTPVYTLQNLNVKMFGFKNGAPRGYDAVIAAGTAILIDDQGMPRARCACGNPLLAPNEETPTAAASDGTSSNGSGGDDSGVDITTAENTPSDSSSIDQPSGSDQPGDDQPGGSDQPGGDQPVCPELRIDGWTDYVAPDGDRWRFDQAVGAWIDLTDIDVPSIPSVVDLPGWRETCDDGRRIQIEPICPHLLGDGGWTPYLDSNGDQWLFDVSGKYWKNATATPTPDPVTDMSRLPGWAELCGDVPPGLRVGPCPPAMAAIGDSWTAPDGRVWQLWLDGAALVWDDVSTPDIHENVADADLATAYDCVPPFDDGQPSCPPSKPIVGDTWIDTSGHVWIFGNHTGGDYGWDDTSTPDIEITATGSLPSRPDGCDPEQRQDPCPNFFPRPGDVFVSPNGDVWVWDFTTNVWTNDTDPTQPLVTVTSRLPGYREECMPPCPPLQVSPGEQGLWVDPYTGTLWTWFEGSWVDTADKSQKVSSSADLPGWMNLCAPPCLPGVDEAPNSFVLGEDDRPEQNPDVSDQNGDSSDEAVTVEPSDEVVEIQPINPGQVSASRAPQDLCDPEGCIDLAGEPTFGQEVVDNQGSRWTYITQNTWVSEDGVVVTDVSLIPGYAEACSPGQDRSSEPCPPEFQGGVYVDSQGIQWTWTGTNVSDVDSDHGRRWSTVFEGGEREYRATIELESWFDDCPPPIDPTVEIQRSDIDVDVQVKGPACTGDTVSIVMFAIPSDGESITDYKINIDAEGDGTDQDGPTTFSDSFVPEAPGEYTILGLAIDSSGKSGQDTETLIVYDCGGSSDVGQPTESTTTIASTTTTTQSPNKVTTTVARGNSAPKITLTAKPTCIEAGTNGDTKVTVTVTVSDADGDVVDVTVKGSSASRTLPGADSQVTGSGSGTYSFTVDYRDRSATFTIEGRADDGTAVSTATVTIKVTYPGGCNPTTSTTSPVTTTIPKATTTTTTLPRPVTTTGQNTPGRLDVSTQCIKAGADGTGSISFTVTDADGLKDVQLDRAVVPASVTMRGSLAGDGKSGQFAAQPVSRADAGKTWRVSVIDAKGVKGSYSLNVPAFCS